MSEKLGYFPALDGVRAAAIGLVLFQHFDVTGGWLDGAGLVGVDLFFALSGYLITSILLGEWRQTGTLALTAFYRRRVFRIWPAFLVFLAIVSGSALLRGANVGDQTQATLAAVFSYMNWSHALGHGPASSLWHCWSLSIEEQFYLVWPALLLVLLSRRGVEGVAPVIAALWLVGVLWRLWLAHEGASSWRLYYGTDTHADSLLAGCILATLPAEWRSLARMRGPQAAAWIGLCAFALYPKWNAYWFVMEFAVVAGLAGMVVAGAAQPGAWSALSSRPAVWLGRRSYSLYLWNVPVQGICNYMHLGVWDRALAGVPASILLATLSYRFVEAPFIQMERRRPTPAAGLRLIPPAPSPP